MRYRLSAEDQKFRDECREFLQNNIPQELRDRVASHKELGREDFVTTQRILNANGLADVYKRQAARRPRPCAAAHSAESR